MTSQVFKLNFESKIAAFLDTHLLFALDAGTKQLIGCKWVIGTVDCAIRILIGLKYDNILQSCTTWYHIEQYGTNPTSW